MKFNIFIIALIGLIFTFCKNPNTNPDPSMDSSPMMTGFPASSNNSLTAIRELDDETDRPNYHGVYEGTLPAASGEGIATTLTLFDDNRYVLQTMYTGQDDRIFEEHGRYAVVDGIVTLDPDDKGDAQYFRIDDKYITKLDNQKQEITGEHATDYRLNKK